jgi:hypothetical protein
MKKIIVFSTDSKNKISFKTENQNDLFLVRNHNIILDFVGADKSEFEINLEENEFGKIQILLKSKQTDFLVRSEVSRVEINGVICEGDELDEL